MVWIALTQTENTDGQRRSTLYRGRAGPGEHWAGQPGSARERHGPVNDSTSESGNNQFSDLSK